MNTEIEILNKKLINRKPIYAYMLFSKKIKDEVYEILHQLKYEVVSLIERENNLFLIINKL